VNTRVRLSGASLAGVALLLSAPAAGAEQRSPDIEVDVAPANPLPSLPNPPGSSAPPVPPAPPPIPIVHDQPPAPANPHTELEAAPPTADQSDQWPAVPKGKEAFGPTYPVIHPYASIVGGVSVDIPYQYGQIGTNKPSNFADRVSTIMMSDIGLRGALLPWLSFESEIMANGGISLEGTSVFEGQASLQVRKQVIHLAKQWWSIEVGRIVDEASVDYFSYHVADCFLMDPATEPFLLFDGFNLGNGVRATAELFKGFRLGFNFNAGNPTSSSAIFAFGGAYPPYSNIFSQAAASVPTNASSYPDNTVQAYVFTPSIMYKNKYIEGRTELQYFFVNLDAINGQQPTVRGYNTRANIEGHIADDLVMPFVNFSYGENDTVQAPMNGGTGGDVISSDRYVGVSIGGGVDVNYQKKGGNYNGVGAMFMQDESQVGHTNPVIRSRYYNVGTTYWLASMLAVGLRLGIYTNEELNQRPSTSPQPSTGDRLVLGTLRLVL
jgi:hypothetical protein